MLIQPISRISLYGNPDFRKVQRVITRRIESKDKELNLFIGVDENGNRVYKLYYLKDKANNWIMSKLVYFINNKLDGILTGRKKGN